MSYDTEVLADTPIIYLKLDETSGTSAADSSGNANNFTYQTGVSLGGAGIVADGGTSAAGNGTNRVAALSSVPAGLAGTSWSLEAWCNLTGAKHGVFLFVGSGGSNGYGFGCGGTNLQTDGTNIQAYRGGIGNVTTTAAIGTGGHHCVVTYSSTAWKFYVDSVQVATASGGFNTPTATVFVGDTTLAAGQYLDNVAVYGSTLSATRIAAHYTAGTSGGGGSSPRGAFRLSDALRRQAVIRASSY